MLLLHQTGSVRVGEVVRYSLTYTPSQDRILPSPTQLHVKIKNTSAIPLRAAYLHGPYTLYVSCYPSTFDPFVRQEHVEREGRPEFEPQLKAGGSWSGKLTVPEDIRHGADSSNRSSDAHSKSFTWIIEVASQVLFSTTAAVHYELLVGRDEKSVSTGLTGAIQFNSGHGVPGKLEELQRKREKLETTVQTKGIFSKAIRLAVDDTDSLWNSPPFPTFDEGDSVRVHEGPKHGDKRDTDAKTDKKRHKPKKIHLVLITHGLHSNTGADMLFMKESIDTAAKQARKDAAQGREDRRVKEAQDANDFGRNAKKLRSKSNPEITTASPPPIDNTDKDNVEGVEDDDDDDNEEEQVLVRGFRGNAVKTERGIQYLGKRLAKYALSMTYPDQPYLPVKSSIATTITRTLTGMKPPAEEKGTPTHKNSSIVKGEKVRDEDQPYKITSISFVSHSLGGLVQTYAIAYIQKHSPEFFERIKPVNFVAMATPFLGLSNENPMYVKFALDFGLVGRTGQDLGLTWRPTTITRNGWGAMVNGLINDPHKDKEPDPQSKPLLRILPTGPAHQALKRFRNRTVYSNVVNDGIVPLRTSCLLFLDWRGLGRVEKARRENGLVGTMVNWGWNEMTGQNASTAKKPLTWHDLFSDSGDDKDDAPTDAGSAVPQADASQGLDYDQKASETAGEGLPRPDSGISDGSAKVDEDAKEQGSNAWNAFLAYFKPQAASKPKPTKTQKTFKRAQTVKPDDESSSSSLDKPSTADSTSSKPRGPVRGSSLYSEGDNIDAPPKTTVFESAGDLLAPPLPPMEYLLDPAARPRTIFHDRVYHPDDIPPPPAKRQKTFLRRSSRQSSQDLTVPNQAHTDMDKISSSKVEPGEQGSMKIEEKIARAYHKDMSWRKVLVRLEPDAHNNMIVRRMFANAYGWPVVKHMCDTHFAHTMAATTADEDEPCDERAKPQNESAGEAGEEVRGQASPPDSETVQKDAEEPRRKTVDPMNNPTQPTSGPTVAQEEQLKTLHSRVKEAEEEDKRRSRTPSEIRESRDAITDLVTMVNAKGETSSSYSSMHSGMSPTSNSASATLHRLARQDSARWSDRFFEGSDEDDSDEEEKFFDQPRKVRKKRSKESGSGGTGSRRSSRDPLKPQILTDEGSKKIVDEPGDMESDVSSMSSNSVAKVGSEQADISASMVSGVGLGLVHSTTDHLVESPTEIKSPHGRSGSLGIAEQVAHAQGQHGHEKEENEKETRGS